MDLLWVAIGFAVCLAIGYRAAMVYFRAHAARIQIADAVPYEVLSGDFSKTLLVLGDSTAVGVGAAAPEESVAGLVAAHIGATYVENRGETGACVEDLKVQIETAKLRRYDLILVQIGGNDIVLLRSAKRAAQKLDILLMSLPEAGKVILFTAGNVGGATTFPMTVRPFHTWTNLAFHKWFAKVAKRRKMTYVNLYEPASRDLFIKEPERYLSEDGLHPSSEGYALWFEKLRPYLI